jgi:hypothetical protein
MGRMACTEPQCLYKGALYLYLTPNKCWDTILNRQWVFPSMSVLISYSCSVSVLHNWQLKMQEEITIPEMLALEKQWNLHIYRLAVVKHGVSSNFFVTALYQRAASHPISCSTCRQFNCCNLSSVDKSSRLSVHIKLFPYKLIQHHYMIHQG